MGPFLMSVIVLACVLCGMVLGMFLRNRLPKRHLRGDTKDVVKLGTGLIGTIASLESPPKRYVRITSVHPSISDMTSWRGERLKGPTRDFLA